MVERVFAKSPDGKLECVTYSDKYLDGALMVLKNTLLDSPLYIATEIYKTPKAQEEMLRLFQELLRNNSISIVLREISTDRVVGICLNVIERKPSPCPNEKPVSEKIKENFKTDNCRALIEVEKEFCSKFNPFEEYKTNCVARFHTLAILPEFRNKKLGTAIASFAWQLLEELKMGINASSFPQCLRNDPPEVALVFLTHKYGVNIAKKADFQKFVAICNSKLFYNGRSFADRLGDSESATLLCGKRIDVKSKI